MRARVRDTITMAAIVVVVAAITIAFGERIGINDGLGWDGESYSRWAQNFGDVIDHGVTVYHSQRLLPSAIICAALSVTGAQRSFAHVILGFQLLDTITLVLAALLWARIASVMAWSRSAAWAGFVAVFASFANARHALYYPTLSDPAAFTLGLAMTWAYLERRDIALWFVAFLGAFTWPAIPPVALGLLILRRADAIAELDRRWLRPVAAAVAVAAAVVACVIAMVYLRHPYPPDEKWANLVPRDFLPLSIGVLAIWTALGWYVLARQGRAWNLIPYVRSLNRRRLALAIASAVILLVLRSLWVARIGTQGPGPTREQFQNELLLEALRGPLWDLVHHVVYFGPIVIIAIAAWRRIAVTAATWGPSAVLTMAMIVAFAIGSESRKWIHLFPFLAVITIAATADWWTPRRTVVFAALCLAWSKLWWPLRYDQPLSPFEWPNQRYFMQLGPWASTTMFLVHLVAVVVTCGVLVLATCDPRVLVRPSESDRDVGS